MVPLGIWGPSSCQRMVDLPISESHGFFLRYGGILDVVPRSGLFRVRRSSIGRHRDSTHRYFLHYPRATYSHQVGTLPSRSLDEGARVPYGLARAVDRWAHLINQKKWTQNLSHPIGSTYLEPATFSYYMGRHDINNAPLSFHTLVM